MGLVYKAIDPDIPAVVALKSILPEHLQGKNRTALLQRFRNEVIACRRLKHTNIVATYAYHEFDDTCYIVMEYVEGETLSDFLRKYPSVDINEAVKIMEQLLSALDCAHSQGVIHRDIKPSNIMIKDDGVIQVTDFGIAKLEASDVTLTHGALIGSPGYIAPEQCSGKPVDMRADLFSAGVVLYQLLTGRKPFARGNLMNTIEHILTVNPVKPSLLNNSLPPAIDAVVFKALAKKPAERFQSATEFSKALRPACADDSKTTVSRKTIRRNPMSSLPILIVGVLIIGTLLTLVFFQANSGREVVTADKNQDNISSGQTDPDPAITIKQESAGDSLQASINRLTPILANFECSSLEAKLNQDGKIQVSGSVKSSDLSRLRKSLEEAIGELGFQTSLTPLDPAFCRELTLLMPYRAVNETQSLGLNIKPYQHPDLYVAGETIQLEITPPEQSVYLYADYIQSDGTVVHLYPVTDEEHKLISGNNNIVLGDGQRKWEVTPPFGQDVICVIASAKPLFDKVRSEIEDSRDYFSALKESLEKAAENSVIADYFYITTAPRVDETS